MGKYGTHALVHVTDFIMDSYMDNATTGATESNKSSPHWYYLDWLLITLKQNTGG